jgi:8-amino-3,8-dideoxy-alpha-D-manno-octulosonate transaminase
VNGTSLLRAGFHTSFCRNESQLETKKDNPMKNRREFLATVGAAGAASILVGSSGTRRSLAAEGKEKLAIDGGTPVRKTSLCYKPYGPQFYDDVEKRELLDVLESKRPFRWWGGGDSKVLQFEKAYADHIGVKHALGVTSGTTALFTAMAALEIGPGDEVILPAWTWYADYDAVVLSGALPVFVEIDESFSMDPTEIEARITPRTKAIIPSSLQGPRGGRFLPVRWRTLQREVLGRDRRLRH